MCGGTSCAYPIDAGAGCLRYHECFSDLFLEEAEFQRASLGQVACAGYGAQNTTVRRKWWLLAAGLPVASILAFGCGGGVASTSDAASGNGAHSSTGDAMGAAAAGSDAGDAWAPAGSGMWADASSLDEDAGAHDAAATPISWDGRAPLDHRASATACPLVRDAGVGLPCPDSGAGPLPGNLCAVDSDCTAGSNGLCLCIPDLLPPPSGSGPSLLYTETACSYDECFVDSDCGPRVPCDCRVPNVYGTPNVCLSTSNCAVDSDCAWPGFCSPSNVTATPNVGFFCHTSNDTCIDDSDCPVPGGPFVVQCRFDAPSAAWRCFQYPSRP